MIARKYRVLGALNLAAAFVVGAIAVYLSASYAGGLAESRLRAAGRETLAVQTAVLTGMLDKYRLLPALLSHNEDVRDIFASGPSPDQLAAARTIASDAAGFSSALDIVFFTPDGHPLLSGRNLFDTDLDPASPLITAAVQGRLGRQARVFDDGRRAYVFANGVRNSAGTIVGIVAVFINLEELEATWSLSRDPIYAVAETGQIFISNRAAWRLRPHETIRSSVGDTALFDVDGRQRPHLDIHRHLPLLNWELHVLADTTPVLLARTLWGVFAGLGVMLFALGAQAIVNRQWATTLAARRDRAIALRLERIVRDRTNELSKSNISLAREVEERKLAEEQLRRAQAELVQTGKLAALGQMSASLSHEFNQPLGAAKSYADNALKYLDRGRIDDARGNIARISELADRMADISRHLRNFARKPNPTFGAAPVDKVIEDALAVLNGRIREAGAKVRIGPIDPGLCVRGGPVRLQQVLVNLISNALDAMEAARAPMLEIGVHAADTQVKITVRDHGPGIAAEAVDSMFDPFYTTKEVGKGLGLGLSISYNIIKDFGGKITAENHPGGGAIFTIELNRAEISDEAAE